MILGAAGAATFILPANANGRVVSYVTQSAGPYNISLGTIPNTPAVGNLHLSLQIEHSTGPISTAIVTVVGVGPSELSNIGPIAANTDPMSPSFYDVTLNVDREGIWKFTIEVSSSLGDGSTVFAVEVHPTNPLPGTVTMVVLIAFLTILGLSIRAYLHERTADQQL